MYILFVHHVLFLSSNYLEISIKHSFTQWRGNYFRTGGARSRAPKSGTWIKVLRWNWSVFLSQK